MTVDQPSAWLVSQLGEYALDVRRCVAEGLNEGHRTRQAAQHQVVNARTFHGYGGPWPAMFDTVTDKIMALAIPGAYGYKPPNAPYWLAVVNRRVVWPIKHSDTLQEPISLAKLTSKVALEVASALIAAPPPPNLFADHPELQVPVPRVVTDLEPGTTVLFVPYVCNPKAPRVLAAWIGEATVNEDGTLNWIHVEEIPLAGRADGDEEGGLGRFRGGPTPLGTGPSGAAAFGFTEGDLPELNVASRPTTVDAPTDNVAPATQTDAADESDE